MGETAKSLNHCLPFLRYLIEPHHWVTIAQCCLRDDAITKEECSEVMQSDPEKKADVIIQIVCQENRLRIFPSLIAALWELGLHDIADVLKNDRKLSTSFFQDYYLHVLKVYRGQVVRSLKVSDVLFFYGLTLLDKHTQQKIEVDVTEMRRAAQLLYYIAKRPGKLGTFIEAMREHYPHLVDLLEGDEDKEVTFRKLCSSSVEEVLEPLDLHFIDLEPNIKSLISTIESREERVKKFLYYVVIRDSWYKTLFDAVRQANDVEGKYSTLLGELELTPEEKVRIKKLNSDDSVEEEDEAAEVDQPGTSFQAEVEATETMHTKDPASEAIPLQAFPVVEAAIDDPTAEGTDKHFVSDDLTVKVAALPFERAAPDGEDSTPQSPEAHSAIATRVYPLAALSEAASSVLPESNAPNVSSDAALTAENNDHSTFPKGIQNNVPRLPILRPQQRLRGPSHGSHNRPGPRLAINFNRPPRSVFSRAPQPAVASVKYPVEPPPPYSPPESQPSVEPQPSHPSIEPQRYPPAVEHSCAAPEQMDRFSSRLEQYNKNDLEMIDDDDIIGSGSFGEVCRCFIKTVGNVAVKKFKMTGSKGKITKHRSMVQREANVLCRFHHTNIVRIIGISLWSNMAGIIMEYVDGGSLADLLYGGIQLELAWITRVQIARGIVSALSYIHNYKEKKIFCHGDVKPENVLLMKSLQVKLADFGSASLNQATGASATTLDATSTTQHTPIYAAPEYLRDPSREREPSMDMYSFGMVIYELVTKKVAYSDCAIPSALIPLILAGNRPNPSLIDEVEVKLQLPDERSAFDLLKSLMESCWLKNPKDRPLSKSAEADLRLQVNDMQKSQHTEESEYERLMCENATASTSSQFSDTCEGVSRIYKGVGVRTPLLSKEGEDAKGENCDIQHHRVTLRNYQLELAEPSIRSVNNVVVAPTGTGKTHVALYITEKHLESEGKKVVLLVPTVPLVQQHYECFERYLTKHIKLTSISGGSEGSVPLAQVLNENQVLIMTHQVLLNALLSSSADVSQISLLIFDECHHTMRGHPYMEVMDRYMKKKRNSGQDEIRLPQIVGLTASPVSGKAKTQEKAIEHIMKLLGNLDVTTAPVQVVHNQAELSEFTKDDEFDTIAVDREIDDQFSDTTEIILDKIERRIRSLLADKQNVGMFGNDLKFDILSKRGSQMYEQDVLKFMEKSILLTNADLSQKLQLYAKHLRVYNDALLLNEHVRPSDAVDFITNNLFLKSPVNESESEMKELFVESGLTGLAGTEPSPLLRKLAELLRDNFTEKPDSRCIVFARTREISRFLVTCIEENLMLRDLYLQPEYLTCAGARGVHGGLTKAEQENQLQRFKEGECKLLIATTVAEEGLDIRACNLVVTYNHTTNEVAQVQRKGRGRAKMSKMYVLAYSDRSFIERERINSARHKLTLQCLQKLREMDPDKLAGKIRSIRAEQEFVDTFNRQVKRMKSKCSWELQCKKCHRYVTTSDYVRLIKNLHHVIVDPSFQSKVVVRDTEPKTYSEDEIMMGRVECDSCLQSWGVRMLYRNVPVMVLKIASFVLIAENHDRVTKKTWKDAPFKVEALSNEELVQLNESQ